MFPPMDTIAAIATAPGRGALAVVRISGPEAPRVAAAVGLGGLEPRRATVGRIRHPGDGREVDRVVATRFVAPASYTGEEVVELSCHGGALVPALVLDAVCAAGARVAEPGEFTRRAFLNGKLDLIQVEATLDLIDARSEAHHRAALFQLDGALSRRISDARERIVRLSATLAYEVDFPDEDEPPVPRERVAAEAAALEEGLEGLLRHAPEGELLREGALTVIAGRPNSGKSSLFNHLLGERRAIVTELAGTTRDAIEALLSVEGYPFRLVDTAGLRGEAEYVEGLGIEVARRYLDRAALVILCAEAGPPLAEEERAVAAAARARGQPVIVARTKADRLGPARAETEGVEERGAAGAGTGGSGSGVGILVSARTGEGVDALRAAMAGAVFSGLRAEDVPPLVTRRRQARAIRRALRDVGAFREAYAGGVPPEVADTHLQAAAAVLEGLLGAVDVEDVLDVLFASFCVGK